MTNSKTEIFNKYNILLSPLDFCLNISFSSIRRLYRSKNTGGETIVIISLHKIGDSVFTIPAINEIIKKGNKNITILCFPESIPIYEICFPSIHYCKINHSDFYLDNRIASRKARKILNNIKPGIIYDLTGVIASASLIFNSRATKIVGMNAKIFRAIYDFYSPVRKTPHLIDMYLNAANINKKSYRKQFTSNIKNQNKLIHKIMIHPFAGWKAKEWSFNNFINLAIKLSENYSVSFLCPKNGLSQDIKNEFEKYDLSFEESGSIQEMIDQINRCSAFIGNDSGPVYIAGLLGKPTFTIFGPTNPGFSASIGDKHEHICGNIKCLPQGNDQYCFTNAGRNGCPTNECMKLLGVDTVYEDIKLFLDKSLTDR